MALNIPDPATYVVPDNQALLYSETIEGVTTYKYKLSVGSSGAITLSILSALSLKPADLPCLVFTADLLRCLNSNFASIADLAISLASRASIDFVKQLAALKVNKSQYLETLETLATKEEMTLALLSKASALDTANALNLKANKSDVFTMGQVIDLLESYIGAKTVADLAARDALQPGIHRFIWVTDPTGDPDILDATLPALYMWEVENGVGAYHYLTSAGQGFSGDEAVDGIMKLIGTGFSEQNTISMQLAAVKTNADLALTVIGSGFSAETTIAMTLMAFAEGVATMSSTISGHTASISAITASIGTGFTAENTISTQLTSVKSTADGAVAVIGTGFTSESTISTQLDAVRTTAGLAYNATGIITAIIGDGFSGGNTIAYQLGVVRTTANNTAALIGTGFDSTNTISVKLAAVKTNADNAIAYLGTGFSAENTVSLRVSAVESTVATLVPGFKGYYATEAALNTAFPTGSDGFHAIVAATGTFWAWLNGAWRNTSITTVSWSNITEKPIDVTEWTLEDSGKVLSASITGDRFGNATIDALTSYIQAAWKFSDGALLTDSSPGGNTLSNNGTVTQADGKSGKSAVFSGSNYLHCSSGNITAGATTILISVWVKPSALGDVPFIFESTSDQSETARFHVGIDDVSGHVTFGGRTSSSGSRISSISTSTITSGSYAHILALIDTSNNIGRISINGTIESHTMSFGGSPIVNDTSLSGTMIASNGVTLFSGQIDELYVWKNATLSESEFSALASAIYNSGTGRFYGDGLVKSIALTGEATTTSAGLMSAADKTNLESLVGLGLGDSLLYKDATIADNGVITLTDGTSVSSLKLGSVIRITNNNATWNVTAGDLFTKIKENQQINPDPTRVVVNGNWTGVAPYIFFNPYSLQGGSGSSRSWISSNSTFYVNYSGEWRVYWNGITFASAPDDGSHDPWDPSLTWSSNETYCTGVYVSLYADTVTNHVLQFLKLPYKIKPVISSTSTGTVYLDFNKASRFKLKGTGSTVAPIMMNFADGAEALVTVYAGTAVSWTTLTSNTDTTYGVNVFTSLQWKGGAAPDDISSDTSGFILIKFTVVDNVLIGEIVVDTSAA